jgi:hypothetical protein
LEGSQGFNCGSSTDIYQVTNFVVTPWPMTKNTTLKLVMTGTMTETETIKDIYINVIYQGKPIYNQTLPDKDGTIQAGSTYTAYPSAFMPGFIPSGAYGVQARLRNTDGQFLNCWQVNFSF